MLGLAAGLQKGGSALLSYVTDNLKLYLDFKKGKHDTLKFPCEGSTEFDVSGTQYIDIPTITLDGSFTVSAWIYPNSVTEDIMVVGDTANEDYMRMNSATVVRYEINNSQTDWTHGLTFTATEWQYMTWTRDSSNVNRMYRNGVLGGTTDTLAGE